MEIFDSSGIPKGTGGGGGGDVATDAIFDAKGDLVAGTGPNAAARLPVGTNDQILMADSAQSTGLKWAGPATTTEIADVAANEDAGISDTYARGDHVHVLANDVVSDGKLRNSGACSVIGRAANSSGDPADISADADDKVLARRGGSLTFAKIEPGELNFKPVRVLTRVTSSQEVQNDATETAVLTYTVPGGTIGTDGALRVTLLGDYFNNSGAGDTIRFRLKFGGTEFWGDISTSISAANVRRPLSFEFIIANLGATNSQYANGHMGIGAMSVGATTAGEGDLATTILTRRDFQGTTAVDTTANQDLVITIQHTTANLNISFRRRFAVVELLPAA